MALTQVNSEGIKDGEIKDADVNASAAIAKSKLASLDIVNADVNASAAIAGSKLAAATTSAAGSMSAADKTKLDGVATSATANPSAPALTGSTNNTICTVTGANAIQGEANLTYDGTDLKITTDANGEGIVMYSSGSTFSKLSGDANRASENQSCLNIQANWDGTPIAAIDFVAGADTTNKDDGKIRFQTTTSGSNIAERMRIESDGNVKILDGDLVIGTANHGIDFSATGDGSGTDTSELLNDYEEGTWTPTFGRQNNSDSGVGYAYNVGAYTKIGRLVTVRWDIDVNANGDSGNGAVVLNGLPYTAQSGSTYGGFGAPQFRSSNLLDNDTKTANSSFVEAGQIRAYKFSGGTGNETMSTPNATGRWTGEATYYVA